MRNRKGFTLIELLVVVAIIALLISILLPSLARDRDYAKMARKGTPVAALSAGDRVVHSTGSAVLAEGHVVDAANHLDLAGRIVPREVRVIDGLSVSTSRDVDHLEATPSPAMFGAAVSEPALGLLGMLLVVLRRAIAGGKMLSLEERERADVFINSAVRYMSDLPTAPGAEAAKTLAQHRILNLLCEYQDALDSSPGKADEIRSEIELRLTELFYIVR